jgi:hypothetical protein
MMIWGALQPRMIVDAVCVAVRWTAQRQGQPPADQGNAQPASAWGAWPSPGDVAAARGRTPSGPGRLPPVAERR